MPDIDEEYLAAVRTWTDAIVAKAEAQQAAAPPAELDENTERVTQAFRDGDAYQRAVAAKLEELGGDPTSPQWAAWCRELAEWNAATR